MKIAVLGTGVVGQTIAGKLLTLGHDVTIGTRNVADTLARTGAHPDNGTSAYMVWAKNFPNVKLDTFANAAAGAELVVNASNGMGSMAALQAIGQANLANKVLIDIANPLDFSQGMPPSLFISNTDSLGEQIQKAFPQTRVVKTLNSVNAHLMVNPQQLAEGDHSMFVSGNDAEAKAMVTSILKDWFGWKDVIDLGDITTARGTEMVLALWVRVWGALQNPLFAFKVVR